MAAHLGVWSVDMMAACLDSLLVDQMAVCLAALLDIELVYELVDPSAETMVLTGGTLVETTASMAAKLVDLSVVAWDDCSVERKGVKDVLSAVASVALLVAKRAVY